MPYADLDGIGRPSNGSTLLTQWGDQVDDNCKFLFGDIGWTAVTFTNGWGNYGGGTDPVGYQMVGKLVVLRGAMAGGALNVPAFTLPVGYRPTGTKTFVANNSNSFVCGLQALATGVVQVLTGANNTTFVALDQVLFLTT